MKQIIKDLLTSYQQQVTEKTEELNNANTLLNQIAKAGGPVSEAQRQKYLILLRAKNRANGALDVLENIVADLSKVLK